ncbi:MAG: cytochrome P450 [Streptosporangiaceae bacterium]
MHKADFTAVKFDALEPAVLDDPYPVYADLRAAGRVCPGGPAQWVVTRYADVEPLLRDNRLSSEFPAEYHRFALGSGPASAFLKRIILTRDPPDHIRLRRLMGKAFSAGYVRTLGDHIRDSVDRLLASAMDTGRLDAVGDLGFPLPVLVISDLLGIPPADRDEVWPRAADLAKALGTIAPTAEERACADEAVVWLREYLGELLEYRRAAPGDDQLSRMIAVEENGQRLSDDDILDNAVFLFFAGFETTRGMISNGCAELLLHPDQTARLREDPALIPTAVEEFVRYDSPIQWVARIAREPIAIGDHTVRRGRVVMLLLGSANRDERRFPSPDRFDVGRTPNPHVGFGGGFHHCLGRALARAEGRVLFSQLLNRFAAIEPAGTPVRRPHPTIRCYAAVPMSVRPR